METNNIAINLNHHQRLPAVGMAEDKRQTVLRVLLAVEHEALQIVNAAKAKRVAKLQQAKQESEIEVAGLQAEMELEFQKAVTESTGNSGANLKLLEQDSETKINSLKLEAEKVRDDITFMLLQHVMAVRL